MMRSINQQLGMGLIEAVVAMAVMSVLGLSTAVIAAKAMNTQRHSVLQSLVIGKGREQLQANACTSALQTLEPTADASMKQSVSCVASDMTATVKALNASNVQLYTKLVDVKMPILTTTATNGLVQVPIKIGHD